MYIFIYFRYRRIFLDLVERVTHKINTFGSINDEIYDDDVSICLNIIVYSRGYLYNYVFWCILFLFPSPEGTNIPKEALPIQLIFNLI